jgi:hypothetical protein
LQESGSGGEQNKILAFRDAGSNHTTALSQPSLEFLHIRMFRNDMVSQSIPLRCIPSSIFSSVA